MKKFHVNSGTQRYVIKEFFYFVASCTVGPCRNKIPKKPRRKVEVKIQVRTNVEVTFCIFHWENSGPGALPLSISLAVPPPITPSITPSVSPISLTLAPCMVGYEICFMLFESNN
jgi:hypothetical protein